MTPDTLPGRRTDLKCGDCGSRMTLRSSRYGVFYGCVDWPKCDGTHGAEPDGSPKGVPADRATREARMRAHAAFDRLWKEAEGHYQIEETGEDRAKVVNKIRRVARGRSYGWLEHQLGLESTQSHMGSFDAETCERVVELCEEITYPEIRAWWKARKGRGLDTHNPESDG